MRGRDVAGVLQQYTKFVKPAHDTFVAPSRRSADVIIPWARCAAWSDQGFTGQFVVQHSHRAVSEAASGLNEPFCGRHHPMGQVCSFS